MAVSTSTIPRGEAGKLFARPESSGASDIGFTFMPATRPVMNFGRGRQQEDPPAPETATELSPDNQPQLETELATNLLDDGADQREAHAPMQASHGSSDTTLTNDNGEDVHLLEIPDHDRFSPQNEGSIAIRDDIVMSQEQDQDEAPGNYLGWILTTPTQIIPVHTEQRSNDIIHTEPPPSEISGNIGSTLHHSDDRPNLEGGGRIEDVASSRVGARRKAGRPKQPANDLHQDQGPSQEDIMNLFLFRCQQERKIVAEKQDMLEQQEQMVDELTQKCAQMKITIDNNRSKEHSLQSQLTKKEDLVSKYRQQLDVVESYLKTTISQEQDLKHDLLALQNDHEELRAVFKETHTELQANRDRLQQVQDISAKHRITLTQMVKDLMLRLEHSESRLQEKNGILSQLQAQEKWLQCKLDYISAEQSRSQSTLVDFLYQLPQDLTESAKQLIHSHSLRYQDYLDNSVVFNLVDAIENLRQTQANPVDFQAQLCGILDSNFQQALIQHKTTHELIEKHGSVLCDRTDKLNVTFQTQQENNQLCLNNIQNTAKSVDEKLISLESDFKNFGIIARDVKTLLNTSAGHGKTLNDLQLVSHSVSDNLTRLPQVKDLERVLNSQILAAKTAQETVFTSNQSILKELSSIKEVFESGKYETSVSGKTLQEGLQQLRGELGTSNDLLLLARETLNQLNTKVVSDHASLAGTAELRQLCIGLTEERQRQDSLLSTAQQDLHQKGEEIKALKLSAAAHHDQLEAAQQTLAVRATESQTFAKEATAKDKLLEQAKNDLVSLRTELDKHRASTEGALLVVNQSLHLRDKTMAPFENIEAAVQALMDSLQSQADPVVEGSLAATMIPSSSGPDNVTAASPKVRLTLPTKNTACNSPQSEIEPNDHQNELQIPATQPDFQVATPAKGAPPAQASGHAVQETRTLHSRETISRGPESVVSNVSSPRLADRSSSVARFIDRFDFNALQEQGSPVGEVNSLFPPTPSQAISTIREFESTSRRTRIILPTEITTMKTVRLTREPSRILSPAAFKVQGQGENTSAQPAKEKPRSILKNVDSNKRNAQQAQIQTVETVVKKRNSTLMSGVIGKVNDEAISTSRTSTRPRRASRKADLYNKRFAAHGTEEA